MIPAQGTHLAEFRRTADAGNSYTTTMRVEAWDDEGLPLVVGKNGLVLAQAIEGFLGLRKNEETIRAVIPGGGWRVRVKNTKDTWEEFVVAWVIDYDGWATPLTPQWSEPDKMAPIAGPAEGDVELLPPQAGGGAAVD
ncbi:hypothetical protein ACFYON_27420 [Micromonospora sp. NPDC005686]|uniref:hypothetical protein n=1 Tax=Micromonospora sp. NPDC005686 TaxID=3364233 RepID=UPI003673EF65